MRYCHHIVNMDLVEYVMVFVETNLDTSVGVDV